MTPMFDLAALIPREQALVVAMKVGAKCAVVVAEWTCASAGARRLTQLGLCNDLSSVQHPPAVSPVSNCSRLHRLQSLGRSAKSHRSFRPHARTLFLFDVLSGARRRHLPHVQRARTDWGVLDLRTQRSRKEITLCCLIDLSHPVKRAELASPTCGIEASSPPPLPPVRFTRGTQGPFASSLSTLYSVPCAHNPTAKRRRQTRSSRFFWRMTRPACAARWRSQHPRLRNQSKFTAAASS
jgi:hypothetical protein